MTPTEAIPFLVVVLLLVSIGGGDVRSMALTFQGDTDVDDRADVHVVAGGTATVPGDATVDADVYVVGGSAVVEGTVDGDVTLLDGNLTVGDGATVTGRLRAYAGSASVDPAASVGRMSVLEAPTPARSPLQRVGGFLLRALTLGAFGWWLLARHPALLENVGAAVAEHPVVSGVVGALAATTLLVLFVYMAFTLLLLPVSVAGLVVELLLVLYGQVAVGYVVGRRLPVRADGPATVAGVALVLLAVDLLGTVPYVGGLVQLGVVAVGFGAVVNTYLGLQRFEPVSIPGEF